MKEVEKLNTYGYPINSFCLVCGKELSKKQECFCSKECNKKYYINLRKNPRPRRNRSFPQ